MPETIFPALVLRSKEQVPSIEVDNDAIDGTYKNGAWERLIVVPFTIDWIKTEKYAGTATIWMRGTPSVSFHHQGYSVFIAQFGLPMSFFEALEHELATHLPGKSRFSDYVLPNENKWVSHIHIQDGKVWTPSGGFEWEKASPPSNLVKLDSHFSLKEHPKMGTIRVRFTGKDQRLQEIYAIIREIYNSERNQDEELINISTPPRQGGNPRYENRDSLNYFDIDFDLLKSMFEALKDDFI